MKNIKTKFMIFLYALLIFTGCAIKEPQKPKAVNFTVISPMIRLSDAGFLRSYDSGLELQIYSSGVNVLEILIKDKICMNKACKDELVFNKEFLAREHYRGILAEILRKQPIYDGRNLMKTECGFSQNFSDLSYEICGEKITFKDNKFGVRVVLREIK